MDTLVSCLPLQVKALLEVQTDTLESTKRQVDKKQTRTVEERDQEIQEEEQGALPEFNEVFCKFCFVGAAPSRLGALREVIPALRVGTQTDSGCSLAGI